MGYPSLAMAVPTSFFDGKCLHKSMLYILYAYYYVVFETYFRSTTDPNLANFIKAHEQTIIAYHEKGGDLALVRSTRYGKRNHSITKTF